MKTRLAFKSREGKAAVTRLYESFLEHWPSPNEKFHVDTGYGKTFVIACGEKEAPPLILLHGSGMNSVMWMGDAREYSGNYRVYAVDIPGEPGKSDERQLPFGGSAFAGWLGDVYKALSLEKASLIGISLGAWLAAKFSAAYPEKVDRLALLCPAGIGRQRVSFILSATAVRLFGEKAVNRLFPKVNGDGSIPEAVLNYQKLIGENFNFRREIIPLFSDNEIRRLTMPILLFVGDKDVIFHSGQTAKRLGSLLPQANINVLPGAGHVLVNLTDRITGFLAQ